MKQLVCIFNIGMALCLAQVKVAGQCVIEGTVALPRAKSAAAPNQRYQLNAAEVDPAPGPQAVVYLVGNFPSATTNAPPAKMVQKNFRFEPVLLPVQAGTTVQFPNQDTGYHNVFSYSKTKRFDLGRYRAEEKPATVVFDKPGVVKLYCEIHEHMRATILVLDTPHFTVTDPAGKFRLEQLPPGNFVLKAWLDEKRVLERAVTLKDGETARVEFPAP